MTQINAISNLDENMKAISYLAQTSTYNPSNWGNMSDQKQVFLEISNIFFINTWQQVSHPDFVLDYIIHTSQLYEIKQFWMIYEILHNLHIGNERIIKLDLQTWFLCPRDTAAYLYKSHLYLSYGTNKCVS